MHFLPISVRMPFRIQSGALFSCNDCVTLLTGNVSKFQPETLMINRFFDRPNFYSNGYSSENSELPFNFALKQQLLFADDLEEQLLELERRFATKPCPPPIPQQRIDAAAFTTESACEPCTYDDFGLVVGLELDVSWM